MFWPMVDIYCWLSYYMVVVLRWHVRLIDCRTVCSDLWSPVSIENLHTYLYFQALQSIGDSSAGVTSSRSVLFNTTTFERALPLTVDIYDLLIVTAVFERSHTRADHCSPVFRISQRFNNLPTVQCALISVHHYLGASLLVVRTTIHLLTYSIEPYRVRWLCPLCFFVCYGWAHCHGITFWLFDPCHSSQWTGNFAVLLLHNSLSIHLDVWRLQQFSPLL